MICNIGLALEGKRETEGSGKMTDVRKISWRINDSECVCTTAHVSNGFSEAVETNDQQHSAFCFTYSSWKVYKTLKLSSFVSLHVPLFSFTLNAFHFSSECFYHSVKVIELWTASAKFFLYFFLSCVHSYGGWWEDSGLTHGWEWEVQYTRRLTP